MKRYYNSKVAYYIHGQYDLLMEEGNWRNQINQLNLNGGCNCGWPFSNSTNHSAILFENGNCCWFLLCWRPLPPQENSPMKLCWIAVLAERASEPIHFFINQQIKIILIFWIDWRDWMEVARSATATQSFINTNQPPTQSNQKSLICLIGLVELVELIERNWVVLLRHLPFHFLILICLPFPLQTKQIKEIEKIGYFNSTW